MSEPTDPLLSTPKPVAKTAAQRQADLRRRRQEKGRVQCVYWLTPKESAGVKAFLAGSLGPDIDEITAERDRLESLLENSQSVIRQQQQRLDDVLSDWRVAVDELRELRQQLNEAERALKEKPAKTFKVPELAGRRALIVSAMSQEGGWQGDSRELSVTRLKQQADLAKKFATEIRQARSRLLSLIQITSGEKLLEQTKTQGWGAYSVFRSPLLSPAEKALLAEASLVMGRIETDVERAGGDVDKLHKKREEEEKARRRAASAALDAALFRHLDRRGEILFIAAVNGTRGWVGSGWDDLLEGAKGKGPSWKSAAESFREALQAAKETAVDRVASGLKDSGKGAEELAKEIAEKYHHADTREKYGDLADKVTAYLVSEQLSKNQ